MAGAGPLGRVDSGHVIDAIHIIQEKGHPATLQNIAAVVGALLPHPPGGLPLLVARLLDDLESQGVLHSDLGPDGREWKPVETLRPP